MNKMRSLGITAISLALTAAVVSNAYYQKKQFYPSVVYITKSNPSMAVIYVQSLVLVLMLGKLMRKVFLGTLRAAEFEHLMERFWYALTETCLAFTVFRDDFNPKFVALFTVLLFLKSFHWLAEERVDYMERSPVIGAIFHVRVSALLTVLGLLDYLMISHAYYSTVQNGATVQLVFGFEYSILITMIANITIKYILHAAEMRSDNPWDNKAVFLLYTELAIGFIRVVLYILFVVIMMRTYTLPLFAFRPMYLTMRNFKKALNDVILSRRAIRNMNTLYPDATAEELAQSDNICIICREDMISVSKKLPCGHIFHTACLRSWFQRQQTCPTCRLNILRTGPIQQNDPAAVAGINNNNNNNNQPNANPLAPNNNNLNAANNNLANPFATLFNAQAQLQPNAAFPMMPPMPMASPFAPAYGQGFIPFLPPPPPAYMFTPPPQLPANLGQLSDEELRLLEGNDRKNVEERIKVLRNIQLLMDASMALMHQYSAVVATLPPAPSTSSSTTEGVSATPASPASSVELQSSNVTSSPNATSSPLATVLSTTSTSEVSSSNAQSEPAPSSSSTSDTPASPVSAAAPIRDENLVTIEDVGREDDLVDVGRSSLDPSDEPLNELRKRRLQRFENTETTSK